MTLTKLQRFVLDHHGLGVDFDGKFGFQCVDLAREYLKALGIEQFPPVAGAKDIWDAWQRARIENTPDNVPSAGSVIIWKDASGPGHVAIFLFGDNRRFLSFDENYPPGSLAHIQAHNYDHVQGWFEIQEANNDA